MAELRCATSPDGQHNPLTWADPYYSRCIYCKAEIIWRDDGTRDGVWLNAEQRSAVNTPDDHAAKTGGP